MTTNMDIEKAREDLAFMKSLVAGDSPAFYETGLIYGAAGLLYGVQCVINWADLAYGWNMPPLAAMINGFLPTVIFMIIIFAVMFRNKAKGRSAAGFGESVVSRSMGAAFAGAGVANIVLAIVFAAAALKEKDWAVWFYFPVTVTALQGAVWFAVAIVRRRLWMGAVAAGWFLVALAAGLMVRDATTYLLVLGAGMFACMVLPGYALMRISRRG